MSGSAYARKGTFQVGGQILEIVPREYVAEVAPVLASWQRLKHHGILPHGGGYLDQTQGFLIAMDIIDGEIESMRADDRDREAKRHG